MRLAGVVARVRLLVGLGLITSLGLVPSLGLVTSLGVVTSFGLVTSLGLGGCTPGVCGRSTDCASGLVCTTSGTCVVPADASTGDAAPVEIDAGVSVIRDADGDAYDIEPIDARESGADANLIDAPDDDSLSARRTGAR
ncbi:MAG: hypothetical protein H7138_26995 [Myxococcales bacterium]|nr:hypothetical protein [Myxococcales bacterium]